MSRPRHLLLVSFALVAATAVVTASAAAATIRENERYDDFAYAEPNPCAAEVVVGTAKLHTNFRVTFNDANEVVDAKLHLHLHDSKAEGHSLLQLVPELLYGDRTGARYVVKDQFQTTDRIDLPDPTGVVPLDAKFAVRGRLTIKLNRLREDGTYLLGDDFYLRAQVIAFVDASGNPVVLKPTLTADCK